MKAEGWLFAGMAAFFAVTGLVYGFWAREPAGKAILAVAFLMSGLIALFWFVQHRRRGGGRAQDRGDAEIAEAAGPVGFFPARSGYPALTAVGVTVLALGLVFARWLVVVGALVLGYAVFGFIFQYRDHDGG
ncbi:aa3-type cytochrome oxidase subunit IV [Kitasatospora xanthocidica]|uniref:aa3-type cytochrome oxidase subunit IV n=1 Tax=Kitasatospora xanthocidica TaxID=83382 RepID=UPI001678907F|nr:cytochrome c oxidase subunit 4 [Kitasatospora xanthocidica]GHF71852.1 cytochrome c oxidase polypeptide 4 [Kitasatospora xanthocidica]